MMKMSPLALAVLTLALAPPAWAVDPCRQVDYTVDEFTNEPVLKINRQGLDLQVSGNGSFVTLTVGDSGVTDAAIPRGTEALWLLENGDRVTLVSDRPAQPESGAVATQYSASTFTIWQMTFPLSLEAAWVLAGSPTRAIRYSAHGSERTIKAKGKEGITYQRDFACVTNTMQARGMADATSPEAAPSGSTEAAPVEADSDGS